MSADIDFHVVEILDKDVWAAFEHSALDLVWFGDFGPVSGLLGSEVDPFFLLGLPSEVGIGVVDTLSGELDGIAGLIGTLLQGSVEGDGVVAVISK